MLLERVAHRPRPARRRRRGGGAETPPGSRGRTAREHEPGQERHCLVTPRDGKARMRILVTGATDGLGRRVAQLLAERGDDLLVHGRSADKVERVAREVGAAGGYVADLASLAAVRRLAADVEQFDALVNNAGLIVPERRESADGYELGRRQLPVALPAHAGAAPAPDCQRGVGGPAGARLRRPDARAATTPSVPTRSRSSRRSCSRSSWRSGWGRLAT